MDIAQLWRDYAIHVAGAVTAVAVVTTLSVIFRDRYSAALERVLGRRIRITSPRPLEILGPPPPHGGLTPFLVRGTLKPQPPLGHEIWLLTEVVQLGEFWPQGGHHDRVKYNYLDGTWEGRVNAGDNNFRIHAVVAPPTSDDFFKYYHNMGEICGKWVPLKRIPIECKNRTEVQPGFVERGPN